MKTLRVPRITANESVPLSELSAGLDAVGTRIRLDEAPWPDFPYTPLVEVVVAHTGTAILLRYEVRERAVLAQKTRTNSPVNEDSCVELFLAPGDDGLYYNFEWSCIGTCLAGVGSQRHGRELLSPNLIARIRRASSLGTEPFLERREDSSWSIVALIPVALMTKHRVRDLGGTTMAGNFYKCGDHLSVPHYVTWSPIDSPVPDYHRPEQFGKLLFTT